MNDNDEAGDDLTEAQCDDVLELQERIWLILQDRAPEVIANVLPTLIAEFLGRWGQQYPRPRRRRIQIDICLSLVQLTFDLLELRESRGSPEPRKGKH